MGVPSRVSRDYLGAVGIIILAFTGTYAFRITSPVLAFYLREELQASLLGVSLLTIGYRFGRGVASYLVGRFGRGRARLILPSSILLNVPVVLAYYMAREWYLVAVLRVLQGVLAGFLWPLAQAVLVTSVSREVRGRFMSTYYFIGSIALPAGNFTYATFLYKLPLHSVMWISAAVFIASAVIAYLSASLIEGVEEPRGRGEEEVPKSRAWGGLREGPVFLSGFAINGISSMYGAELTYVYIREAFSVSRETTSAFMGFVDLIALVAQLMSGFVVDKLGAKLVIKSSVALSVVGTVSMLFKELHLTLLGLSLIAVGLNTFMPSSRAYLSFSKNPTASIGTLNMASNMGTVAGQLTIGGTYDYLLTALSETILTPPATALTPFLALALYSLYSIGRNGSGVR